MTTMTVAEYNQLMAEQDRAYASGELKVRCWSCQGILAMKDAKDPGDGRWFHGWCSNVLLLEAAQMYYDLAWQQWIRFLEGEEFDRFGFGLDSPWEYMNVVAYYVGCDRP